MRGMGGRIAHAPFDILVPRARLLDTSPDAMLVMIDVPAALARTPRRRRDDVAGGPRAREPTRPGLDRRILGRRRLRRRRPPGDVRRGRRGVAREGRSAPGRARQRARVRRRRGSAARWPALGLIHAGPTRPLEFRRRCRGLPRGSGSSNSVSCTGCVRSPRAGTATPITFLEREMRRNRDPFHRPLRARL